MLNKSRSLQVIRLCGLLPISFVKNKFTISKIWYLWSCIATVIAIAGSIYRFEYTSVADDYQTEPNKVGYIFDILLKIEPLIIVVVLALIQYPVINVFVLKKHVNFLNSLNDLCDIGVREKLTKWDRLITVIFVVMLSGWLLTVEVFYQEHQGILDLSRHIDVIINFNETIVVGVQSFNFILHFLILVVVVSDLEKKFTQIQSTNGTITKSFIETSLNRYDDLLGVITQFEKTHGFVVRVLTVYAYFDVVAAVKGFIDIFQTSFCGYESQNNTTMEDLLTSCWYLCHLPYLLCLICVGEIIENKVCSLNLIKQRFTSLFFQMNNIRGMINQHFTKNNANQILLELTHQEHLEVVVNHRTLLNFVVTVASYIVIVIQFSTGVEEE